MKKVDVEILVQRGGKMVNKKHGRARPYIMERDGEKLQRKQEGERMGRNKFNKKISVEEYLEFIDSQKQSPLPANFLNQIIFMHGFKRIHKTPKRVLEEAIETIDLVKLSRSTLQDSGISSCAFLSLDDVVADLNELNWQECCVTSIETLSSSKDNCFSSNLPLPKVPAKPRTNSARRGQGRRSTVKALAKRKRDDAAERGAKDEFGSSSPLLSSAIVSSDAIEVFGRQ